MAEIDSVEAAVQGNWSASIITFCNTARLRSSWEIPRPSGIWESRVLLLSHILQDFSLPVWSVSKLNMSVLCKLFTKVWFLSLPFYLSLRYPTASFDYLHSRLYISTYTYYPQFHSYDVSEIHKTSETWVTHRSHRKMEMFVHPYVILMSID